MGLDARVLASGKEAASLLRRYPGTVPEAKMARVCRALASAAGGSDGSVRVSRAALLLLAGVAVVQLLYYYPAMPDTMASHFDGAGRPNGFQSRDGFFALTAAMLGMVVVLFGGFRFLFRVLPARAINVPDREYWLAPERFDDTIDFMVRQMEWMGVATLLLLILVLQGVFEANQSSEPMLDSTMWWLLGGYFLYTAVWLFRFLRRFRKPQILTASS